MPSKSLLPSTSSPTATRDGLPATSLLLPPSLRSLVTIGWFQVPVMCNPGPAIQPLDPFWSHFHFYTVLPHLLVDLSFSLTPFTQSAPRSSGLVRTLRSTSHFHFYTV